MKTLKAETRTNRFVSIRKVLVAIDLSRHSEATATYAAEMAKSFGASLTIVHVYEPVPLYDYKSETTYTVIENQCEDLQKLLDELTRKVQKTGVVCDSVFRVGDPAEEIAALARDIGADLIVTASHHPMLLARLFNLDKAPQIMYRTPCPVLVYHEKNA
jgi:nucleotide-binding universal stress UspA family protein